MPLTDTAIRNAKPGAKPIKLFDERGLYLELSPTGASGGGSSTASPGRKNGCPWGCTPMSVWWIRNGEVTASIQVRVETDRLWLIYRHRSGGGEWKDENYPVWFDWTPCHLGSQRLWFRCPARGCKRRVAILYGGGIFACRHCYKLAYPSQRETSDHRALRRADRIRARLGWVPGIVNGGGLKPKGMHWRTFMRLFAEYNASVDQSLAGMAVRIGFKLQSY
jgi:hypothetical protein